MNYFTDVLKRDNANNGMMTKVWGPACGCFYCLQWISFKIMIMTMNMF